MEMNKLIHPAQEPPRPMVSVYGNNPEYRAWTLPEMVSVNVKDLFPNMPEAIYDGSKKTDLSVIDKLAREAMAKVDMSSIKPDDTINLVCCEHGFLMFGGDPYVQMLKTIKKYVEERTGNYHIRLKLVMYRTPKEGYEVIEHYHLEEEFDDIESVAAYDKGVPIETRIGTVYGLDSVYNGDKFIFAYYDDPREVWCSNYYRKSFKAFTMDMARFETRALFHFGFGAVAGHGPVANVVPTAIYDSDFVQSKFAFCCFMRTTPAGLLTIDADNNLYELDNRAIATSVKFYPYMHQLLLSVDNYNVILDNSRWPHYSHGGGMIAGINWDNWQDHYDLEAGSHGVPNNFINDGLATVIFNQTWCGLGFPTLAHFRPVIIVGDEQYKLWKDDPTNKPFTRISNVRKTDTLPEAMKLATELTGSDKYVIYDGSYGFINCSRNVAEELIANAPAIQEKVDALYPMYMEQRGLEIPDFMR